jgi:hypothetical protein
MASSPTYTCPFCGATEYPLTHSADSSCGGVMVWQGGDVVCTRCGKRNGYFRCHECGRKHTSFDCLS